MSIFLKKEMHFVEPLNKAGEFVCSNKHLYRKTARDLKKAIS